MRYAEVKDGLVVAISSTLSATTNEACGDAVVVGWEFNTSTSTFTPAVIVPPTPPPPTAAQIAVTLAQTTLSNGLNIVCSRSPTLNSNYSLTSTAQSNITAVITYILLNSTFPGGVSSMAWSDSSGVMHMFSDVDTFKSFATAMANFVASVTLYGDSGGTQGAIPANTVTIA